MVRKRARASPLVTTVAAFEVSPELLEQLGLTGGENCGEGSSGLITPDEQDLVDLVVEAVREAKKEAPRRLVEPFRAASIGEVSVGSCCTRKQLIDFPFSTPF